MPKLKTGTIALTPDEEDAIAAAAKADPDAVPFIDAEWAHTKSVVRRVRPLGRGTETQSNAAPRCGGEGKGIGGWLPNAH